MCFVGAQGVHASSRKAIQGAPPGTRGPGRRPSGVAPGCGSGWGAVSFVKSLKKDIPFEVILVSPRNYFLYTPLLPGVATGAIETRSIVESIRRPIAEKGFKYYEAAATDIDAKNKIVTCRKANNEFTLKYDYLITAVGAVTNTFGVPGVDRTCTSDIGPNIDFTSHIIIRHTLCCDWPRPMGRPYTSHTSSFCVITPRSP